MRLVDTSAWIEWLLDCDIGQALSEHIPEQDEWLVPTIVQMEMAKWLAREGGEGLFLEVLGFSRGCEVVELDTDIAIEAAQLAAAHKLSTADAIIYATALAHGADLLTCDRHFHDLPHVRYVAKLPH